MRNPYTPPRASLEVDPDVENNSGGGSIITPPAEVRGWSWGAFFLSWIWALGNRTWVGLLALAPYVGFFVAIYLGIKGRELAWRNKRWDSFEHFDQVQKRWSFWGVLLVLVSAGLGIFAAIAVPAYQQYVRRHGGG
jgi:hypothetical protein